MKTIFQSASSKIFHAGILVLFSSFIATNLFAGVIVSPTNCNAQISADKAANAWLPAFTTLNDIIIKETKDGDFVDTEGRFKTLILTAPSGWTFKTLTGTVTCKKAGNVRALSMKVSASAITLRFISCGLARLDLLTISGIMVQAIDGADINGISTIYRSIANPGTLKVAGITATNNADGHGGTAFAVLTQNSGAAAKLAFEAKPGQSVTGTYFEQQPVIITLDQFGNPTSTGLASEQMVRLKLSSGTGNLTGVVSINIGTSGGNGRVNCSDLLVNATGSKKLMATSGSLTFAVSHEFTVSEEDNASIFEEDNPDWICFNR